MRTSAILICLAIFMGTVAGAAPALVPGEFEAVVTWVLDGDSIKFRRIDDLKAPEEECRMLHYNAPEMTRDERRAGRKARDFLKKMLFNRRVVIWGVDRDRYGRLLCEVRLTDGTYVNEKMRELLKDYPKRDIFLWMEKTQHSRGAE